MTTELRTTAIDAENPWPGLSAFDEASQAFFAGRDAEAVELVRLVSQAPLTVLFGKSGLGKTSLIQAGLFPRVRQRNLLPVYVRLDVRSRSGPLIEQLGVALDAAVQESGVEAAARSPAEGLWPYLHRDVHWWSRTNQPLTPLFVIDQFEEVFTLGAENTAAIEQLRLDLSDLVENRIPMELASRIEGGLPIDELDLRAQRYKLLLSFREDFLPEVEGWKRALPSVMRNRLRLLPMHADQALQVVGGHSPGGRRHDLVSDDTARAIVAFVAAVQKRDDPDRPPGRHVEPPDSRSWERLDLEPALLSLVCQGLNEKRKSRGRPTIDAALLEETGHAIISDFYRRCVADVPGTTRRFIEDALITEGGFRNAYPLQDALDQQRISADVLARLVERRLLRVDHQLGTSRVELIHDRLTDVVRQHRNDERARRERRRQRWRLLVSAVLGIAGLALAAVMYYLWREAGRALERAQRSEQQANASLVVAEEQSQRATEQAALAGQRQAMADAARRLARSRELAAFSLEQLERDPELAILLAREAIVETGRTDALPVLQRALRDSLVRRRFQASSRPLLAAAFLEGGRRVVTAGEDGRVRIWSVATSRSVATLAVPGGPVRGLTVTADGRTVIAWSAGQITAWNAEGRSPRWQRALSAGRVQLSPCWPLLSPGPECERALIEVGDELVLLDTTDGRDVARIGVPELVGAGFSQGGKRIITVSDSPVPRATISLCGRWRTQVWHADTGAAAGDPVDWGDDYGSVFVNEFGSDIVSGSTGRAEMGESCSYLENPLWLLLPNQKVLSLESGSGGRFSAIAFSPRGVVAIGSGSIVTAWTIRSSGVTPDDQEPGVQFQLSHAAPVTVLRFSDEGEMLLSAAENDTMQLSARRTGFQRPIEVLATLRAGGHRLVSAVFSRDGRHVLTAGADGSARLWAVPPYVPDGETPPALCARCRTDDDWLAFAATRLTRTFTNHERTRFGIESPQVRAPAR